jgi:hypothetical protein
MPTTQQPAKSKLAGGTMMKRFANFFAPSF